MRCFPLPDGPGQVILLYQSGKCIWTDFSSLFHISRSQNFKIIGVRQVMILRKGELWKGSEIANFHACAMLELCVITIIFFFFFQKLLQRKWLVLRFGNQQDQQVHCNNRYFECIYKPFVQYHLILLLEYQLCKCNYTRWHCYRWALLIQSVNWNTLAKSCVVSVVTC